MSDYDVLEGGWLVEWTDRISCESGFAYDRSRTQEFRPFHLDLDYPAAGAPTGSLSKPDTDRRLTSGPFFTIYPRGSLTGLTAEQAAPRRER